MPAFVASRVQTKPFVLLLSHAFDKQGLLPRGFEARYDSVLGEAVSALRATLSETRAQRLDDVIEKAMDEAYQRAANNRATNQPQRNSTREPGEALVVPAGGEDPERQPDFGGL